MDELLREVWLEKLHTANELMLIEFIFEHNYIIYLSRWRKGKWEHPIEIDFL